jgi:3-hydroxybutyryl-CoA dehydrogenase
MEKAFHSNEKITCMGSPKQVCIYGSGYLGSQIALQCAVSGLHVNLFDVSRASIRRSRNSVSRYMDQWVIEGKIKAEEKGKILSRMLWTGSASRATAAAEIVIEAVTERLNVKREVFKNLDRLCGPNTILATNSSSIRVSKIEDATNRPDRVLNMHFYGFPWRNRIVEIMRGTKTSDETMGRAKGFSAMIGLTPLIVLKESTGFIFNRVWRAVKRECLHLVDEGVATHEDVDRAWMSLYGTASGPFGMMDRVGLDVVRDIEMTYYEESGNPRDYPPRLLVDKINRGELGVKTGRGFYKYPNPAFEDPSWLHGAK